MQPLEAKGAGGEDQQTTPSLGNILLQPEEPGWGQDELLYESVWELTNNLRLDI